MAQVVGYVKSIENGTFYAKDSNGKVRLLKSGDTIAMNEVVYGAASNAKNAKIVVDLTNNGVYDVAIAGDNALKFDLTLLESALFAEDAVVEVQSLQNTWWLTAVENTPKSEDDDRGMVTKETAAGEEMAIQDGSVAVEFTERNVFVGAEEANIVSSISNILDTTDSDILTTIELTSRQDSQAKTSTYNIADYTSSLNAAQNLAERINVDLANVIKAAADIKIPLSTISTDYTVSGNGEKVKINIAAGPLVDGNLRIELYDADGKLIAQSLVDNDGRYTFDFKGYSGVIIAKLVDLTDSADYIDEATGGYKDFNMALVGTGFVNSGGELTLNINPVTSIAYQKMNGDYSEANVAQANKAVANVFGLGDDINTPVVTAITADGSQASENAYGSILAALSGMDKINNGDGQKSIEALANGITLGTDGGATLSREAILALDKGATLAAINIDFGTSPLALVSAGASAAVAKIGNYYALDGIKRDENGNDIETPTLADFNAALITGVPDQPFLDTILGHLNNMPTGVATSITAVQNLVDIVGRMYDTANGVDNGDAPELTKADFNFLGYRNINTDADVKLIVTTHLPTKNRNFTHNWHKRFSIDGIQKCLHNINPILLYSENIGVDIHKDSTSLLGHKTS